MPITSSQFSYVQYLYRLVAIPLATLLLIIGSLVFGIIILPFYVHILRQKKIETIRTLVSKGVKVYLKILNLLRLLELKVVNNESLNFQSPVIFIANHPSLFDVLFFISQFPTCSCIVKKSLSSFSPYFLIIHFAKYIVDTKDSGIIVSATNEILAGRSVVIFPEGTRTSKNMQNRQEHNFKFHRGAANIHIASRAKIVPVTISCDPPALAKDHQWYEVPDRKCLATMRLHNDFCFRDRIDYSIYRGILSRKITSDLEFFYNNNLTNGCLEM